MKSLDKLANLLQTNQEEPDDNNMDTIDGPVDAVETPVVDDAKGENKAYVRKGKRSRKHSVKSAKQKQAEKPKHRPKHFVQF
jgi:hypothetical protein